MRSENPRLAYKITKKSAPAFVFILKVRSWFVPTVPYLYISWRLHLRMSVGILGFKFC